MYALRPLTATLALLVLAVSAPAASATVRVSRAELNGSQLRVEGTAAASKPITVNGTQMTTSDGSGNFKISRDGFAKPADCKISVNDGSATPTPATLSGCSVSTTTPSPTPAPTTSTAALSTISVSPKDVVVGSPSTGTVRLTAAAPSGGFLVTLTNDDPSASNIPASVTVPAGATSVSFPITTNVIPNPRSSIIRASAGTVLVYAILTVYPASAFNTGSIGIIPGNGGSGTITSSPAGINCVIVLGNGTGTCTASWPVGTVVRLDARPASNSSFQGWRGLPGCTDPSRITVARATTINCQPGFSLR